MSISNNLTNLNHAELSILAKKVAEAQKICRAETSAGRKNVDTRVTLDVVGEVRIGTDYTSEIVLKADPFLLLAVALSHTNGITMESIVKEALTDDPELAKSIKDKAAAAWAKIKAPTKTRCKGKVTVTRDSTVTLVDTVSRNLKIA